MSIKLITFDLDDTLWDTAPVIATAEVVLRDWLEANAPTLGSVPVEHLFAIRERLVQAEPGLKHRISALRRRVLFHALEEVGYSEQHAQALANEGFEVFLHARHQVEIFPEVQPVLEILRHQYILGVVTNG
ncbi:HAD family hydrolase, partial [Pseudomonas qingdaonensis]